MRQTLIKIIADDGAEGYYFGGAGPRRPGRHVARAGRDAMTGRIKSLVMGQDPYDREKFWHWMWVANIQENLLSSFDMALWDLQARKFGVPGPQAARRLPRQGQGLRQHLAQHGPARAAMPSTPSSARAKGYKAYKIHPYYFWDPETGKADPGRPSHVDWDIACCEAVREAVGDDMVLMYDPWGTYRTYEDALLVGRVLERARLLLVRAPHVGVPRRCLCQARGRAGYPHPLARDRPGQHLHPRRLDLARRLGHEPDRRAARRHHRRPQDGRHLRGLRRQAARCTWRALATCRSWAPPARTCAATTSAAWKGPGWDYETPQPYWYEICDPLDPDGYVRIPQEPGMGYKINWDYIKSNLIKD